MANATYLLNPPALLLGAAVLFWGWRTEFLPLAVAMAIVLETARFVSWRWRFSDRDFNRLVDLTSIITLAFGVYLYATRSIYGIFTLAQWLPAFTFLLIAAQTYSSQGTLPLNALLLTILGRQPQQDANRTQRVDLRFPYLAGCILAASVVPVGTPWFYAGICALTAWALWTVRPQRYAPALWGALLMCVIGLGYVGHVGLNRLQIIIGDVVIDWLDPRDSDPYRATTAIGHIGKLKTSDRIVLRVKLPQQANGSLLLREASYNSYSSGIWRAAGDRFGAVAEAASPGSWRLGEAGAPEFSVKVSGYLRSGRGLVAVPNGSYRIENLPAEFVKRNGYGAIKAENGPAVVSYTARFRPDVSFDVEPTDKDLHIPSRYQSLFSQVASQLGLSKAHPKAALARLQQYFRENFRYSLVREREANYAPLSDFLLRSRSGHCEYFATSTALLLRAAGIPTRYATGYSVQEYSELEDAYIVRRRHAHSWALAYIDGVWRDVDFTPPAWITLEDRAASWWEGIYDLGSHVAFLFSRWRSSEHDNAWLHTLVWLLLPLGLYLAWRLYLKERTQRAWSKKASHAPAIDRPGGDSAFYQVVHYLEQSGQPRRPGETLGQWLQRLTADDAPRVDKYTVAAALALHYRYRFDPLGLAADDKRRLQSTVTVWIARRS